MLTICDLKWAKYTDLARQAGRNNLGGSASFIDVQAVLEDSAENGLLHSRERSWWCHVSDDCHRPRVEVELLREYLHP